MRINELMNETENLEEGPLLNKIGTGIGKAVGTAAKGVGAVAGGVAGLGQAVKKGYQAGKSTVAQGGDDEVDPNAPAAAEPAATPAAEPAQQAPAAGGTGLSGAWANFKKGWAKGRGQAPADQASGAPAQGAAPAAEPAGQEEPAPAVWKNNRAPAGTPASTSPQAAAATAQAAPTTGAEQPAAAPQAAAGPNWDPKTGLPISDKAKAQYDKMSPEQKAERAAIAKAAAQGGQAPAPEPAAPAAPAAQQSTAPAAEPAAAPAQQKAVKPAAGGQNAAGTDTFEKAKADIRKVQSGTKPLPDNMIQGVQSDIAKMAKGDKESGVFAAQKIMGFASKGYDIAALQQSWNGNAKAAQRFLTQSVYRAISKMLKEHNLTWADLGLKITLVEGLSDYVGVSYSLASRLSENVEKHKRKMFENRLAKGEFSIFRK